MYCARQTGQEDSERVQNATIGRQWDTSNESLQGSLRRWLLSVSGLLLSVVTCVELHQLRLFEQPQNGAHVYGRTVTHHPSKAEPAEQHTRRMHSDLAVSIAVAPAAVGPATDQAHRVEWH